MEDEGITRCFLTRDHLAQDYLVIALAAIFCLRSRFLAASTRCSPSRVQACYPRCLRCRRRLSCSACVALALMVGTLIFVYLMLRSRRGLALGAIRDHETAAAGLGVDIYSTMPFMSRQPGVTGMVGALIHLQTARISPDAAFSVLDWTAYVIFIVVIGGIGTMEGPIVGTVIFYLMQRYLADFGAWYLLLFWDARDSGHAVCSEGPLGPDRRALRFDVLSNTASARRLSPRSQFPGGCTLPASWS